MSIITRIILAATFVVALNSCSGQDKTEEQVEEYNSLMLGDHVVDSIDPNVWAIFQSKNGDYWFGTNGEGIFNYNGKEIRQYTSLDGLVDNTIRGFQEDRDGNIYVETPSGISKFNGKQFITLPVIEGENEWKLEPGDLWFKCNGNLEDVYRCDGHALYELQLPRKDLQAELGVIASNPSYSPYAVFCTNVDSKGHVWFGTVLAGAYRYDGESFTWFGDRDLSRLPDGREPGVRVIVEDQNGDFWLSHFKSKYRIAPKQEKGYEKLRGVKDHKAMSGDYVPFFNSAICDKEGVIWATNYMGGVWKYDGLELVNYPVKNENGEVGLISIYQDHDGKIWLGSTNAGVLRFDGEDFEEFEF